MTPPPGAQERAAQAVRAILDELAMAGFKWEVVCPTPGEHDFSGWRDDPDGRGGSVVCVHCGLRAMDADLLWLP